MSQSQKKKERKKARMMCGALNWLSKEGRPGASSAASLCSSRINKLVVEDLMMMNEVVKGIKEDADPTLQIRPLERMKLSVVTDAS